VEADGDDAALDRVAALLADPDADRG
jgi:hypothetical protein